MKLSNRRVLHLNAIMQTLAVLERSGGVFKLDGLTRLKLVRNANRLEDAVKALAAVEKALVTQARGSKTDAEITEADNVAFRAEWAKVLDDETEVLLAPVKVSALNLTANGLPQDLLKITELVMDDMPEDLDALPAPPAPRVDEVKAERDAAGKA